jgi:hypothetical protein
VLETSFLLGLVAIRRLPREHDGFGYFGVQYYFLNGAVTGGEIPQWIPYMTQGTVANWWYATQGNLFQNGTILLAPWLPALRSVNFLHLFYLGIWIDVLLLVVGTWLLARRFFSSSATAFFTTAAVAGPCIWMHQPWFNFHFLYAIPLMLELVHRFLDRGSWWYLLLAVNLLALQTIGNLPYFVPMTALVLCLYFALYGLFNPRELIDALRRLRWGVPFAATVALGVGSLAAAHLILQAGTEEIANFNPGRGTDARVQLETFLVYGGEITKRKWAEIALGISPSLDHTLYMGMLAVPLLIAGCCFGIRRKSAHLLVLAGLLLLFGTGGFVAAQAYRWWPLMPYFRHIGLTGSLARLFLCFVAGCGFEVLFVRPREVEGKGLYAAAGLLAAAMVVLAGALFWLAARPSHAQWVLGAMRTEMPTRSYATNPPTFLTIDDPVVLRHRLLLSASLALACAALLAARNRLRVVGRRPVLVVVALVLLTGDVYLFKCNETRLRSVSLPRQDLSLTAFQEMPYRPRRITSFFAPDPRVAMLMRDIAFSGVQHWSTNPFVFVDEAGSSFRADHWLLPLDKLMRTYWGQDVNDRSRPPAGFTAYRSVEFPLRSPAARKLTGVDAEKVQFFRKAYFRHDETATAALLADPRYRGDVLFLSAAAGEEETPAPARLDGDDRVDLAYAVERFDANNLELTVSNTAGAPVWMLFSDVWHPRWRATVDGRAVPVRRADLAYKAVELPPGQSRVHFRFHIPAVSSLYVLIGLCSLAWLGVLIALTGRLCRNADEANVAGGHAGDEPEVPGKAVARVPLARTSGSCVGAV